MHSQVTALSLERIYPIEMDRGKVNDSDSIEIHEARYRFAAAQLNDRNVLDLACGCGFGTALMAALHPDVEFVGVDIDAQAISYAQRHYQGSNIRFVCADAMQFDGGKFDTIVCLETIEHLAFPSSFIDRLPSLLLSGGKVIASVPITPTCDGNPHHRHDFSRRSFYKLFSRNCFSPSEEFLQVQRWVYDEIFSASESGTTRSAGVGNHVLRYYRRHPRALLTRIASLLRYGRCNIYLTSVFLRTGS